MAYSDFNLSRAREIFGLVIEEPKSIFLNIKLTSASDYLLTSLDENLALATAINTEKARSEMVIAPVLLEVHILKNIKTRNIKNQKIETFHFLVLNQLILIQSTICQKQD